MKKHLKTEILPISTIKANPNNPRVIRDESFKKLVHSIISFPKMLHIRPIVVNDDMIILGGNMRLRACQEAGLKEVPVIKVSELTEEEQREFIIKDNVGFGEWNWEMLANEWDNEKLNEWGLMIPKMDDVDLSDFFKDGDSDDEDIKQGKIVLNYNTMEEAEMIKKELLKVSDSLESAVTKLLGL